MVQIAEIPLAFISPSLLQIMLIILTMAFLLLIPIVAIVVCVCVPGRSERPREYVKICPYCGAEIPAPARQCPHCQNILA